MKKYSTIIFSGVIKFRTKKVPDPKFCVGSHLQDDSIFPKELVSQKGVFAKMVNFDFDCGFNIVSYDLSVFHDEKFKDMKASGPEFTDEMSKQLTLLEQGDRLIFSNVKVKMRAPSEDTIVRKINGISLVVK
ncbi:MAG: hypothetical protein HY064_01140 [Bacteroidetes bacterium]|nr:hypothetical protein [Bacteroidota bacterium]